jgi:hypothetical protein
MGRFWSTKHGFFRKMALMVQYFYYMVNLLFGWFGMANFYLSFYLLAQQALFPPNTDPNEPRGKHIMGNQNHYLIRRRSLCV